MKKRIFLHIGTHKTGTTSFQASLKSNRGALIKQGYHPVSLPAPRFARPLRRTYNLNPLSQSFLRDGVATMARLRQGMPETDPEERTRDRAAARAEIEALEDRDLILSSEAFTFLRTPEEAAAVRAFFDGIGRELVVLVVLRNEAAWRASWSNQIAKFERAARLNRKLSEHLRADGAWYFDRDAIFEFWTGFGEVRKIDYDAALAQDGNIIPAIYRAIGVDLGKLKLDFDLNRRVELPGSNG